MEIESVFIDEWGKFGVISKDKRQYWITLQRPLVDVRSFNGIEYKEPRVILKSNNGKTTIFTAGSLALDYFQLSWEYGDILQKDMPNVDIFRYEGVNSVIIGKNGDCYETESDHNYALADDSLYIIDLQTGKKLSNKITPSFTQSIFIGKNIRTAVIDYYQMNSIGLLQIESKMLTFYAELDVGEVVERISKNFIASEQSIHYIKILPDGYLLQCTLRQDDSNTDLNILKTFYGHYEGNGLPGSCVKINGATVTKYSDRIEVTGLKTGGKTKAAPRELTE